LQHKKDRVEHGLFLVEGHKSVVEFINSPYQIEAIYHTTSFDSKMLKLSRKINLTEISANDIEKISSLKTPQDVAALVRTPSWPAINNAQLKQKFSIVLDGLQDPGNMGTIVRTADWFGIDYIICSTDTVDVYNPKVVQASMGSLARVKVFYTHLAATLSYLNLPIFGAMLNGDSIYQTDFGREGLILVGNEGNGVRAEIERLISKAVTIPRIGNAESLNVGIAAAIFCSEVSRNRNNKLAAE